MAVISVSPKLNCHQLAGKVTINLPTREDIMSDKDIIVQGASQGVSDKDAAHVVDTINTKMGNDPFLLAYKKATTDMENFKKTLFEEGKTKDGKVSVLDLSKDEMDKYFRLEEKQHSAKIAFFAEAQDVLPEFKTTYISAAVR